MSIKVAINGFGLLWCSNTDESSANVDIRWPMYCG
jgi:hypothetical protein